MKNRLVFVYQYFYPEVAGSAQQLTDLAFGLREKGYSIEVLTAQPTYVSKKPLPKKEDFQGINVNRLPTFGLSRHTFLGRVLGSILFFIGVFIRLTTTCRSATLLIVANPPLMPLIGRLLFHLRRQLYYILVPDIYPDLAVALNVIKENGWTDRLLRCLNKLSFEHARQVIVLTDSMSAYLKKLGVLNVQIISNWANGDHVKPLLKSQNPFRIRHNLTDKFIILFSGNLGKIYSFDEVIEAASLLATDTSPCFLFIGSGPRLHEFQNEVSARRLHNIKFLPYQPDRELPYSMTCGDLAIIPLQKGIGHLTMPGKTYYALAAGLPLVVVAAHDYELARIAVEHNCGWVIEPGDSRALAELIKMLSRNSALLKDKARNARACYEGHFTRQRAMDQYDALFKETINSS